MDTINMVTAVMFTITMHIFFLLRGQESGLKAIINQYHGVESLWVLASGILSGVYRKQKTPPLFRA